MPKKRSEKGRAPLRVAELFAGVGGFRIGLERAGGFDVIWSDQWEPGRKRQHASEVYVARFGAEGHVCADIASVEVKDIPDHDLLVGGFPCQDYSVASTLKNAKGLVGKKGVLWWQIHRILAEKRNKPRYLLLENVDRLLGSPAGQRGRDLAIMLASLSALGYAVEWRVINAADLGLPQRRKRVFLFGEWKPGGRYTSGTARDRLLSKGFFASALGSVDEGEEIIGFKLNEDLAALSGSFNSKGGKSPFKNAGYMHNGHVWTMTVKPEPRTGTTLGEVLLPSDQVPKEFFIARKDLGRWKYLKGAKKELRSATNGHRYNYSEGAMAFPDELDKPARTIVTGEGGAAPSRFKHVVRTAEGRFRRLTPIELERLNMFPDDHTRGVPDGWRAFFMGNALVTGVVERLGKALLDHHREREAKKQH